MSLMFDTLKSAVTLLVAVALLIAGGFLVAFLIQQVNVEEPAWQRYTYIASGVEAVVFAAVGWLFGKEVHREQAEKAEEQREQSETEKTNAVAAAAGAQAKGQELARAVIAAAGGTERAQSLIGGAEGAMAQLVRHAKSAYPDA